MLQKLQLRKVRDEDRVEIQRLHKQYPYKYHLPTDIVDEIVAISNDKIVGYGALEILIEPVIVIDQTLSLRDKFMVIRQLFNIAILTAKHRSIHDFFLFVVDAIFASILRKHFGFQSCKGTPLVYHVNRGV